MEVQDPLERYARTIETAKAAGVGAWQSQAAQRGYEMLGRYLGTFTDRVEINQDAEIIERLMMGRRYAAGLKEEEDEEKETEDNIDEPQPN
jgi:hypothetical protein